MQSSASSIQLTLFSYHSNSFGTHVITSVNMSSLLEIESSALPLSPIPWLPLWSFPEFISFFNQVTHSCSHKGIPFCKAQSYLSEVLDSIPGFCILKKFIELKSITSDEIG
ncbi:hypothetical protein QN277_008805 [Acacia crassicarpa]|uniref:Uncharacterized protein n=1 Tax=Acacia crassicarpa TaxID=499986 RepID=A0AAE1IR97_9FABA|nr:hypothetical protein QN277_008805 [Acacia crassicarpa]